MDLNYFTYITGIASLLGFILQVFDVFPKHAQFRKSLFLVVLGIFIGSILNAIDASKIEFTFKVSGYVLLLSVFIVVIVGFLIAGAMTDDTERRGEMFGVAGAGFAAFFLVLFFGFLFTLLPERSHYSENDISILTTNELISLSDYSKSKGDIEREIFHLETIKNRFDKNDERYIKIEERIKQEKSIQIQ